MLVYLLGALLGLAVGWIIRDQVQLAILRRRIMALEGALEMIELVFQSPRMQAYRSQVPSASAAPDLAAGLREIRRLVRDVFTRPLAEPTGRPEPGAVHS